MPVSTPNPPSLEIDAGVIEEARRRQQRRRLLGGLASLFLALAVALAWLLGGAASSATSPRHPHTAGLAVEKAGAPDPRFNVRLYPATIVGGASYCEAAEEHGVTGESACGAVPTASEPFTMVFGSGEHGHSTTFAVTTPEVASILVNGRQRVSPVAVPGLPYGLRVARINTSPSEPLSSAIRAAVRREGIVLVAFNAEGHRLAQDPNPNRRQANVIAWGHQSHPFALPPGQSQIRAYAPSEAPCRLAVHDLPGLVALGGRVATGIRPFPGQILGEAFLPCIETEYELAGEPVRALIMLSAANPSARAGQMPGFHPIGGDPGLFAEGGTLTAMRTGNAWLVVGQGADLRERTEVLRHLGASVKLAG